ncbi:GNAT family N-acetyltransferase [Streptomyces sp. NL15-2K]|uniref:GNAT family N-acetyltransferase n=1 Tax=Streptomyces sp. NL15-2K TaxID=376149 RepID=UPI000F56D1B7|nr:MULTISPECIES: GNAT family N-acetyltransferase [Actinomycetes]WKX10498.1 GNAT family N-acetyltransferase [Kutzneria buriramensis]
MGEHVVEVHEECVDPVGWDHVVDRSGAPLFYRSDVLRSYRRHPLQETLDQYYLTVRRRRTGAVEAVLPLFRLPAADPLGVIGSVLPSFREGGDPVLLSHVWHWYDTRLPALSADPALVDAVCQAVESLAAECGVQAFGFINVLEDSELATLLGKTRLRGVCADARYTVDLMAFRTAEDYITGLPRGPRQDLRRQLRRAQAAGARTAVETEPDEATLRDVASLCRATAAKHGNPGWYQPARLTGFVHGVEAGLRLLTVRIAGRLVAASISFTDGTVFHNWTAGSLPPARLSFSPYAVLFHASLRAALDEGCELLEGGRRNDDWKTRLGMTRRPLSCWLAGT